MSDPNGTTARSRRNIGIFAHVDAGKTTLTERMLQLTGTIREAGAVDLGTAHTDSLDVERRRGITVRAAMVSMRWRGVDIHVIDTPGHTDFASEVERAFWALDGAALIISAAEGVRPQTERLYRALEDYGLPFIIFVNKCDMADADGKATIAAARVSLGAGVTDASDPASVLECLADFDEDMLDAFVEGRRVERDRLRGSLRGYARAGKAHPAFMGSALKGEGVAELLDAITYYLPEPSGDPSASPAGIIFAIDNSQSQGRAAHARLFEGSLRNRDTITLTIPPAYRGAPAKTVDYKIAQIRTIELSGRGSDLGELTAGGAASIMGFKEARAGMTIGDAERLPKRAAPDMSDERNGAFAQPLLLAKVTPVDPAQREALRLALDTLASEDPLLRAETLGGDPHVRVMGAVQLEVLEEWLRTRFGVMARFGPPHIVHHETIAEPAVGFYAYTMPKPCWAVIRFDLEPLPRGAGIRYDSVVPAREIATRYQHQIEQALPAALRQGILGWPVDDIKITLTGGEHHLIHTHPLDFIVASPVALMDGLRRGKPVLLEPILSIDITIPAECAGRVQSEITAMRGETIDARPRGDLLRMTALAPTASSLDFHTRLAAITRGRGAMTRRLHGYKDRAPDPELVCPRRGVNPLDTAKYILAARNALDGGIFDDV
ncbi:MAG: TetM/TetW/TetO/TetS family tetracycline resistance ribosomal protection protein [Oscillospiraceae bacterium]|jgi:ribosomal protection tetracycline resistance protein|nr:TetM/TetW/TetO/TetS family tetracycline resistance ribosomal protection protein [Oscillospiraceae bacterium]